MSSRFQPMKPAERAVPIRNFYAALARAYGAQHWWPARTRLEMIAGAYLTQNTSWKNAARALGNLRRRRLLSLRRLRATPAPELAQFVRAAGYFRQKAHRLKGFVVWLDQRHRGSIARLFRRRPPGEVAALRRQLLALEGVGPETADSILLYAGSYPVFVVDAYARRILARHRIFSSRAGYEQIRTAVEHALATSSVRPKETHLGHPPSPLSSRPRPPLAQRLNEFHALLVEVGKRHCHKAAPHCAGCPLERYLH